MSVTKVKGISPGDFRKMLELASDTARLESGTAGRVSHALRGIIALTHAQVGVMARVRREPGRPAQIQAFVDTGWDSPADRQAIVQAATRFGYVDDMLERTFDSSAATGGRHRTFARRDLFDNAAWYASPFVNEVKSPAHVDDCVYSIFDLGGLGNYACIGLHRSSGDKTPFGERERQIADYLWQSLGWLHASPLDAPKPRRDAGLPDDLAPVLRVVRSADKLAGAHRKLGLSAAAFKRKQNALYSHFGVSSRLELLAKLAAE